MVSLIFWRLKYPEQFTEQISVIIIAIFIILVFSIYYIGCVFIQNFIYFKKYYFFFKQRKALPQKDIGDRKTTIIIRNSPTNVKPIAKSKFLSNTITITRELNIKIPAAEIKYIVNIPA